MVIAAAAVLPFFAGAVDREGSLRKEAQVSDHFNGTVFFNPWFEPVPGGQQSGGRSRWIWRWFFGAEWPDWPKVESEPPGPPPAERVSGGGLRVTPVGHSTFLIQMDGLNILTDPIWSDRASPVSVGWDRSAIRSRASDLMILPPIDVVLISHNHYDHLDLPTLRRLAKKGTPRAHSATRRQGPCPGCGNSFRGRNGLVAVCQCQPGRYGDASFRHSTFPLAACGTAIRRSGEVL